MILAPFSPLMLFSIAFALTGIEIMFGSFFIIWYALGFLIVAFVEYFFHFSDGLYQIITAFIIATFLLYILKDKLIKFIKKSDGIVKDDFLNEEGFGIVKEGMIDFKGTLWNYEPQNLQLQENQRVKVKSAKNNIAQIELI